MNGGKLFSLMLRVSMIRVELAAPHLDSRVKNMVNRGYGRVSDWELLERLVEVARRDDLEMEFVRLEDGGEIVFDLEQMGVAIEVGWEVRPLDTEDNHAAE